MSLFVSTSSPASLNTSSRLAIHSVKSDLVLTDSSVLSYGSSLSLIEPGSLTGDFVRSMNSSTPTDVFTGNLNIPEVKSIYDEEGSSGLLSFSD